MHLIVVDTTRIQEYVFGSNRLRENIGGSHLVAQATGRWALEAVPQPHNVRLVGDFHWSFDDGCHMEDDASMAAEVLYAGGGNVVALCRDEGVARDFMRATSRRALCEAPGLQLVFAGVEFGRNSSLAEAMESLLQQLARHKQGRALPAPLLGLSVTQFCRSTGLPAAGWTPKINEDEGYPAAAETLAKIQVTRKAQGRNEADRRLREFVRPPDHYDYPADFDELGRERHEHSYIAIVHADGDGMGKRVQAIADAHREPAQNRAYITALRVFSARLNDAASAALQDVVTLLETAIGHGNGKSINHPNWKDNRSLQRLSVQIDGARLPFRPLVFGGDDVTFVCDGRLGLALAIEYLRAFEKYTANLPDNKGRATACAGIAIVKSHFPFAAAYRLTEELCHRAKEFKRKIQYEGSCFDWHFATGGLSGGIEEIRRREYTAQSGSLTQRPLTLEPAPGQQQHSWPVVKAGVDAFQGEGWTERRNKVKVLRDALRAGPGEVERFRALYRLDKLPDSGAFGFAEDMRKRGWYGNICGYFDAVELMDWFIPLQ